MLIATDTVTGTVVTGPEAHRTRAQHTTHPPGTRNPGNRNPATETRIPVRTDGGRVLNTTPGTECYDGEPRYACSICGERVTITPPTEITGPFEYFHHADGSEDCTATDATTDTHREAIELVIRQLARVIKSPAGIRPEARVDAGDEFVVADVLRTDRYAPVAVEVIGSTSHTHLSRRLSILFDAGCRVCLVVDESGRWSADRIEHHVQSVASAPVRIGRFHPSDHTRSDDVETTGDGRGVGGDDARGDASVSLGVPLSPHVIDVDAVASSMPAYLA